MKWISVDFSGSDEARELLVGLVAGSGETGAEEVDREDGVVTRVFWPSDRAGTNLDRLIAAACARSGAKVSTRGVVERADWLAEWKKHFGPTRASSRFIVCPPWDVAEPASGGHVIIINPEMAFGTGTHESTQLALELLEETVKPGDTVIDVGAGSGILAIAAAKLGAASVLAIEIDEDAIQNARGNCVRNGVEATVEIEEADFSKLDVPPASLVVCNEIAPNLALMLPCLIAASRGGRLIVSGIDALHHDFARAALASAGLAIIGERQKGEWLALVCV
ncbi:MAG: 50S ribosomal protein L11 methyltransferase [Deltaproteobacteria bacterium]|nr:50S ribosomal protein L11 methyltransferase [Deltaproteobacteria bacterium]